MQTIQRITGFALIMLLLWGCGKTDDKTAILGIWRVKASLVDGRDIGDGKSWFEFKDDGTVDTRPRPGAYDSGKYEIFPEKGTVKLTGKQGSMEYKYEMEGDHLSLSSNLPSGTPLKLDCVRADDYPITKENDPVPDGPIISP